MQREKPMMIERDPCITKAALQSMGTATTSRAHRVKECANYLR